MSKDTTAIQKKLRQIMDLLAREIPDRSVFGFAQSFDDLAMTESEILKLRRGVEKILGAKFTDDEWAAVESPVHLLGLVDRKIHGPLRR